MDDLLFTPGPVGLPSPVLRAMATPMVSHRSDEFHELYEAVEEKLKKLLMSDEVEVYLLTASGTGAVEAAVANFIKPGDEVLVPLHGIFSERLAETVRAHGGAVVAVNCGDRRGPTAEEVESALRSNPRVSAAAVVINDTCPGVMLRNFREIAEVVKERGCLLIVDAVSAFGGVEIPVRDWGIDVLATATQKCLAAPPGLSIVAVSEEAASRLGGGSPGTYYLDLAKYRDFSRRRETPFTPALPILYALNEALDFILRVGFKRWVDFHEMRARALYSALSELGMRPFVSEGFRSTTVVSVEAEGRVGEVARLLRREFGIYVAGGIGRFKGRVVRVGNMGYLTKRDVITLVACLALLLRRLGYEPRVEEALSAAYDALRGLAYPRAGR